MLDRDTTIEVDDFVTHDYHYSQSTDCDDRHQGSQCLSSLHRQPKPRGAVLSAKNRNCNPTVYRCLELGEGKQSPLYANLRPKPPNGAAYSLAKARQKTKSNSSDGDAFIDVNDDEISTTEEEEAGEDDD
nr:hypothetical protein Itr_chr06CG12820 [Ipomoea trifida]